MKETKDTLPYSPSMSKEWLEKYFNSRDFVQLKYNKFMWWRTYSRKDKSVNKSTALIDKIKSGYYEYSHYKFEAMLAEHKMNKIYVDVPTLETYDEKADLTRERRKRLLQDFEKEENRKIEELRKDFVRTFPLLSELIFDKDMESFDGTIEDYYNYQYRKNYGKHSK